jgi:GNAT superfamily N-acetyltransferase
VSDLGRDLEIRAITHPKDTKAFVESWRYIYRDDPQWVPPLTFERKTFFHPDKNPYFKVATVQCFMAYRGAQALGTIAATVDHKYQEEEPGTGFFGFFEFVEDENVARALLDAACEWLRERGMTSVIGPFNLSSNHEFALLVDGFDTPPTAANPHNSAYFPVLYEKLGLRKVMDWFAYDIDPSGPEIARMEKLSARLLRGHPEISFRQLDMKRFDEEVKLLHDIYNDAWSHNWGHVQVTDEEFHHLAQNFKSFIDPSFCFVAEVSGQAAGLSVCFPDLNQVVKRANGRIFPFGWYHLLFGRKDIDRMRIFMLGIKHEFQHLPLGAPIYLKTYQRCLEKGVRVAEASLILETNTRMRGALEKMGGVISKTYRSYEMSLEPVDS